MVHAQIKGLKSLSIASGDKLERAINDDWNLHLIPIERNAIGKQGEVVYMAANCDPATGKPKWEIRLVKDFSPMETAAVYDCIAREGQRYANPVRTPR